MNSQPRAPVFLPGWKDPLGTRWIEEYVDPGAGPDAAVKRKIPAHAENRTPVFQPIASHSTDSYLDSHCLVSVKLLSEENNSCTQSSVQNSEFAILGRAFHRIFHEYSLKYFPRRIFVSFTQLLST